MLRIKIALIIAGAGSDARGEKRGKILYVTEATAPSNLTNGKVARLKKSHCSFKTEIFKSLVRRYAVRGFIERPEIFGAYGARLGKSVDR